VTKEKKSRKENQMEMNLQRKNTIGLPKKYTKSNRMQRRLATKVVMQTC